MMPIAQKTKELMREWRFALVLGGLMVAFELTVMALIVSGTPEGQRWLGATIFNTGDVPVYLDYLAQAKDSFLLYNLYNNLPQIPRFDLFWSLGGLLVRLGLAPLWAHEILRWICTLALAIAVYATARAVTRNGRQARIASLLMVSGLSTGWLYDLWMGLNKQWTPNSLATADLASEFAIAPVLLGGAHMILSIALQLLVARWIWEVISQDRKTRLWPVSLILFALSFFHPYFIPLFGLIAILALGFSLKTGPWTKSVWSFLCINAAMLPGAGYYLWLVLNDSAFRVHHLQANRLPLDPWYFWVIMLLPFIPAICWMITKNQKPISKQDPKSNFDSSELTEDQIQNSVWVWAWLASAAVCMLLPFPWMRKYTQALLPALVMLTLPFWLMLADKLWTKQVIWPLNICLSLLVAFPFLHLLQTQSFMVVDPYWQKNFYRPDALFQAWDYIRHSAPPDSLTIAMDLWSSHWTPTYTLRRTWIGHLHETPDFMNRIGPYRQWIQTQDQDIFRSYLATTPVTHIIATTPADADRVARLIDRQDWRPVFEEAGVAVWQRK